MTTPESLVSSDIPLYRTCRQAHKKSRAYDVYARLFWQPLPTSEQRPGHTRLNAFFQFSTQPEGLTILGSVAAAVDCPTRLTFSSGRCSRISV